MTILILSHDVIGTRMAGTGIRYWEMARTLARTHAVLLLAPQPPALDGIAVPDGVTCGHFAWGDPAIIAPALAAAELVIANGLLLHAFPLLADIVQPLVLDLYDPVALENLEVLRHAPPAQRTQQAALDQQMLQQQLAVGDFLMCATERQRDLYLGALLAGGQITPTLTDADPTLRRLLDVVPFGLAAEPPQQQAHALRGVLPSIPADAVIVLWTGGLWDWLDPLTLIRAMPAVVAACPQVRLVFLAGTHPGTIQPMQMPQRAEALAAELGLLDTHIIFYREWVPYARRADVLLDADIAVSLHRNHLETTYAAVRSRFLDHLWAGLPSVVSAGDAAAALVQSYDLGYTIAPEDEQGVARALIGLAQQPAMRQHHAQQARQLATRSTWQQVLAPLRRFCEQPAKRPRPLAAAPPLPAVPVAEEQPMPNQLDELIRRAEQLWQFGSPADAGGRVSRIARYTFVRLLAPVVAQQRDFNAVAMQLFYTMHEQQQQQQQLAVQLEALLAQILTIQDDLHRRLDAYEQETQRWLAQTIRELHARIDTVAEQTGVVSDYANTTRRDLDGRIDLLATSTGDLHDRVTRLTYTLQLLDEAIAAADESSAALAMQLAAMQLPPPMPPVAEQPTPPRRTRTRNIPAASAEQQPSAPSPRTSRSRKKREEP